jgi:hypothetical protein
MNRDVFQCYSLIVFSFLVSSILFGVYGILDNFQVILTVFWSCFSLIYILIGIAVNRKIFRLFGLFLMVAAAAKILLVDVNVLKFYGVMPLFFIDGFILIATSFLYQAYGKILRTEDRESTVQNISVEIIGELPAG